MAATQRLLLRPLTEDDVPSVGGWLGDPDIARAYLAAQGEMGEADVQGALDWSDADGVQAWAIDDRDLGLVAAANSKPDFPWLDVHEIEVTLSPDLPKRRGYGLEAHHLVVDHLFDSRPELRKVIGRAATFNEPAIAIGERVGMVREGCLRRHVRVADEICDLVIYGILRAEWEATAPAERRRPLTVAV